MTDRDQEMTTYTLTAAWLEGFAFRDTEWKPVLACVHCEDEVKPDDVVDGSIESGRDLEQLVRWSVEHRKICPGPVPLHRPQQRPW